jgi:hypothetical protein
MADNGPDRFRQLLDVADEERAPADPDHVLGPLEDLVTALKEKAVGAAVVETSYGRRNLVMWPQNRPARRTSMLSFTPAPGETGWYTMLSSGRRLVRTPQEMRDLLEEFIRLPTFHQSVRDLQDEEKWDVEGILLGRDGSSRILRVSPSSQASLAKITTSEAVVELELDQGEIVPPGFEAVSLDSAGLRFTVRKAVAEGRQLSLTLEPVA